MTDRKYTGRPGWTALKVLNLIVALLGMIGFGFCGLIGVVGGLDGELKLWAVGLLGFGIAVACLFTVVAIVRSVNRNPRDGVRRW